MSSHPPQLILRRLIPGLVLGFLVIVGMMLLGDVQKVSQTILLFQWQYFFIAAGFTLLNYALRFLKWHFYLGQIGVRHLTIPQSLRLFIAGFPLAVTPGKVGEVFKAVWLMRQTGTPVGRGASVIVAERISDGLAVLTLSILGVIAYPQFWPAFLAILAVLIAVIIISQIRPAAIWLLEQGEKLRLLRRLSRTLREFYEGSFALFRPSATLLAVLLGTISWLGEGVGFFFILIGLGLPPSERMLAMAVFVLAFSTVVGAASALPGGLGAAEASIAGLLTLTLHQDPALATTATVLIRLATLWLGVGLGLLVWLFSPDLFGLSEISTPVTES
jgi:glycosyltransferase 2 family protein